MNIFFESRNAASFGCALTRLTCDNTHRKLKVSEYCNLTELCWPAILPGSNIAGNIIDFDNTNHRAEGLHVSLLHVESNTAQAETHQHFFFSFFLFTWEVRAQTSVHSDYFVLQSRCKSIILRSLGWSLIRPLNTTHPLETNPFVLIIKHHLLILSSTNTIFEMQ